MKDNVKSFITGMLFVLMFGLLSFNSTPKVEKMGLVKIDPCVSYAEIKMVTLDGTLVLLPLKSIVESIVLFWQ